MNKRGLSAIIATLLIILLTLVAVGIIWVVIRNVVQGGAEQIDISQKCVAVDFNVDAASCTAAGVCNVTYTRASGGDAIDGVRIILRNGVSSNSTDISGDVTALATRTLTNFATGLTTPVPDRAEIVAYFVDASGNQQLCTTPATLDF